MGEYCEMALSVSLGEVPDDVDRVLKFLCDPSFGISDISDEFLGDHEFFKDERWHCVASRGMCASMHRLGGEYSHTSISIASSVKNGYLTYAKFLDWLAPYVYTEEWPEDAWDGESGSWIELPPKPNPVFGGYLHDEYNSNCPTLIWFSRGKVHLLHREQWMPDE